jgi:hypothetical protein
MFCQAVHAPLKMRVGPCAVERRKARQAERVGRIPRIGPACTFVAEMGVHRVHPERQSAVESGLQ